MNILKSLLVYLLTALFPPVACAIAGKAGSTVLAALLCISLIGYPVASVWAIIVVRGVRRPHVYRLAYA